MAGGGGGEGERRGEEQVWVRGEGEAVAGLIVMGRRRVG